MNKKVMNIMLILLIIITLAGVVTLVFIMNNKDKTHADDEKSVEEMLESSFETEEMTTDLKDGNFVRIQFQIVADEEKTMEKLQKDFRLKNIMIKELSKKKSSDFREGLGEVETAIKEELNKLLDTGMVTDVYTTNKILQ
ncbi:flagellar FliL protein [Salinibacillus kushneri]|uniref:Flagellar protein FliL n=1 Tax=Salinibacillus kushneri TaxID=237682 RepID=A0A1I0E8K2_9BACI|nr:flagellar basal body-associated FliL family protein [Salinibacillus kushneri]SET41542.1 flagellar FliL protein [Salinibacillus kushneri]